MKNVLAALYKGELYPEEQIVSHDPSYRPTYRKISEEADYFKQKLSSEDRDRFERMESLYLDLSSMDAYANFCYGFRLGALLMCEILMENEMPEAQMDA